MTPSELGQLYGLRSHLDAVIAVAEAALGQVSSAVPGICPQCGAAPEAIEDTSTLDGTKRSRCSLCAHEWER